MAVDYFLKLKGIEGESIDEKHKKQIQLMSWSWGAANTSSVAGTGGSGAGKVDVSDFSIMVFFDKSTPKLFKAICAGTHLEDATIEAVKSGADGKPYLKLDFKEVFITALSVSGSSEIPSVSVSFTYKSIKIDYSEQDAKGNLTSTGAVEYDQKENKLTA